MAVEGGTVLDAPAAAGGGTGLAAATLLEVPGTPPTPAPGPVKSSERCIFKVTLTAGSYFSWLSSLLLVSYSTLTVARKRSAPTTGERVATRRRVRSRSMSSEASFL